MVTGTYLHGELLPWMLHTLLLLQILSLGSETVRASPVPSLSIPSETECTQYSQGMTRKMRGPGQ